MDRVENALRRWWEKVEQSESPEVGKSGRECLTIAGKAFNFSGVSLPRSGRAIRCTPRTITHPPLAAGCRSYRSRRIVRKSGSREVRKRMPLLSLTQKESESPEVGKSGRECRSYRSRRIVRKSGSWEVRKRMRLYFPSFGLTDFRTLLNFSL